MSKLSALSQKLWFRVGEYELQSKHLDNFVHNPLLHADTDEDAIFEEWQDLIEDLATIQSAIEASLERYGDLCMAARDKLEGAAHG